MIDPIGRVSHYRVNAPDHRKHVAAIAKPQSYAIRQNFLARDAHGSEAPPFEGGGSSVALARSAMTWAMSA